MPGPLQPNSAPTAGPKKHRDAIVVLAVVLVTMAVAVVTIYSRSRQPVPSAVAPTPVVAKRYVLGFSLATQNNPRWERDVFYFTTRAHELGADVVVEFAENDAARQEQQVEGMLVRGADALVITPFDSTTIANVVDKAHELGVKVIAYDRMINSASLDYYVSFDSVQVGRQQAQGVLDAVPAKAKIAYVGGDAFDDNSALLKKGSMEVLAPKIESGAVTIVLDSFAPKWRTDEAYKIIKAYLTSGGKLDGVVAANDTTAQGVISALQEFGLAGKVAVSGQDADLPNIRNLIEGTQTVDVYKPLKALATKAAEMAVAAAKGEPVKTTGTLSNGKIDVPAVILPSIAVTKDNIMDTVVKDGFYTREDIYGPQK